MELIVCVSCLYAWFHIWKHTDICAGAPAFIYARADLVNDIQPALSGWMGHAQPFKMEPLYHPGVAAERLRIGTPPIVQMAMLDRALDVWDNISMTAIRKQSIHLSQTFIERVESLCPELTLASPRDPNCRGSQVSFRFKEGYAAIQALIDIGVIGDFRAPDIMRFGFTPLYLDEEDVQTAAKKIAYVIHSKAWEKYLNQEFLVC